MATFKIGDRVFCKGRLLSDGTYELADGYDPAYSTIYTVPILGKVESTMHMEARYKFRPDHPEKFSEHNLNYDACWWTDTGNLSFIEENVPATLRSGAQDATASLSCRLCGHFSPYAQANCTDGGFACYSCRNTCGWKLKGVLA